MKFTKQKKLRRCKGCEVYFREDQFEILRPWNNFHSVKCFQAYLARKQEEERRKQFAKLYNDTTPKKSNALRTRKLAAQKACHAYIRERDKNNPCICCGRPVDVRSQAGHYISSGSSSFLRYHEDNIHLQRVDCNLYLGGDYGFYRENLIKKIGLDQVLWLEANKKREVKRKAEDYLKIEQYYKDKLLSLLD